MKKTKLALACAAATALSLGSGLVMAQPSVYGEIGARVIDQEDQDIATEATSARLGLKGMGQHGGLTVVYELEADFANVANYGYGNMPEEENEVEIRSARLLFPTQYGTFVLAPKTPSSQFSILYGAVDIFETYTAAADKNIANIFAQDEISTHVLAYASPRIQGFQGLVSYLTSDETNGTDTDIFTWWLDWTAPEGNPAEGLRFAVGQVYIDEALPNASLAGSPLAGQGEDWVRSTVTASYEYQGFYVGATYEDFSRNSNDFGQDFLADVASFGVVGSYTMDGYTFGVGYFDRDSEIDADDNDGFVVSLKKEMSDDLLLYTEYGSFDQDGQSSFTVGAKLSF